MTRADVIERTARALFDIHASEAGVRSRSGLEFDSALMASVRDRYRGWAARLADAGVLAVSPPPPLPPAGDPTDPDLAPLVCGVDGCNRGPGHEGAHKTSKGRLTRTWKAGRT